MLRDFLRAFDIVLIFLLASISGLTAIQQVRKAFYPSRRLIASTLAAALALGGVSAVFDASLTQIREPTTLAIRTSGVTRSGEARFDAYWDVTGTRTVTEIAWGTLDPGQVGNKTFYVKNEDTVAIYCAVSWNETTWQPAEASQFFSLTWDFGEEPLRPNRARKVVLELHVSPDIAGVDEFSFDIVITGQGEPFTG